MDRRKFFGTCLGVAVWPLTANASGLFQKKSTVRWRNDLNGAIKVAVASNKPVLIMFTAKWCTYCHKLEKEALADPAVVRSIERNYVPVRLDFDQSEEIAERLGVESLPCTVILNENGEVQVRKTGYMKTVDYRQLLADGLEKKSSVHLSGHSLPNRRP